MVRKFKCWACEKTFQSEENGAVKCPYCHSDNVDYAKSRIPRLIFMIGAILALIIIIVVGVKYIFPKIGSKTESNAMNNSAIESPLDSIKKEANAAYEEIGGSIAPSLSLSEIEYNDDDDTYNCIFKIDNPPKQSWKIIIKSYYGEKFIAESENGKFEHLPYSKEDGFYRVFLVSQSTNENLCEERDFPDFPKQNHIKKPWSDADLERALNGAETIVDNPFIAPQHEVIIINKPSKDTTPTGSLGDVQKLLKLAELKATVEKVEYDDMNRISLAKIKINYPADWGEEREEL